MPNIKKGTKYQRSYGREDLNAAFYWVCTIIRKFNVLRGTLQDRLNKKNSKFTFSPSTILTSVEEEKILKWLFSCQERGLPLRKEDLQAVVKYFLDSSERPKPLLKTSSSVIIKNIRSSY